MVEIRYAIYTSAMALSIKSDEADRLARELAAETGETLTEAVVLALGSGSTVSTPGTAPV